MNPAKSSAEQEQKILFLQQKLFEQQQQLQQQQQQQQLMLNQSHAGQFHPQITSTFSFPPPSTGTFLPVGAPSPQREEAFQELFNSVAASPLPETTIFPTPPPIGFKQGKNIALMKQMFQTTEPATEASSASGLLAESLPNFEENIEYDNDDNDDDDDDADEFQDENDEQKGFEQTIQLIKKGIIDKEIKIMTQNKGNGTIQVYDAPTFSCIQNLQPFLKHYLRKKAIAEAQTRKLNRTLNTLISMSSKKAKIRKNVKNKKHTF